VYTSKQSNALICFCSKHNRVTEVKGTVANTRVTKNSKQSMGYLTSRSVGVVIVAVEKQ
jgi:hypothetical protein